jgi:hypothetical protein
MEDTEAVEATNSAADEAQERPIAEDAGTLLRAFRSGDAEAGYAVLGRGATVEQWKEVVYGFVRRAPEVSLERVIGSTLGRPPEVVLAVIELAETIATSEALFVVQAIRELRSEPAIRERAHLVEAKLDDVAARLLNEPESADPRDLLYAVLAQPIARQRGLVELWREAAPSASAALEGAVRTEDERLQELAKERSYKAGSYRHFLRHALADLVLVGELDDVLGRRAYALLQRRVDGLERQEPLLLALSSDVRRRYVSWALDVKNAEAVPRARFALRMIRERFPELADRSVLRSLVMRGTPEVAVEAALTYLQLDIGDAILDREVAQLTNRVEPDLARMLAAGLRNAPAHIRLGEIAPDRRELLFDTKAEAAATGFVSALVGQLAHLGSAREILALLAGLERTPLAADDEDAFDSAAALLVAGELLGAQELALALDGVRLRNAVWRLLPRLDETRQGALLDALLPVEKESDRAVRALAALREIEHDLRTPFAGALVDAVARGLLDADETAAGWPSDLIGLALERAETIRVVSEEEHAEIAGLLERGKTEYLRELRASIEPLVERAAARARGNERLERGYARLLEVLGSAGKGGEEQERAEDQEGLGAFEPPAEVQQELSEVGASLDGSDPSTLVLAPAGASEGARVRYLGVLDQRAARTATAPELRAAADSLLPLYVRALASEGIAQPILTSLFEGGPYTPQVIQLSASTREFLVREALGTGFVIPSDWFDHPALGQWLRELTGVPRTGGADADNAGSETLVAAFRKAREARSALEAAQAALAEQRQSVVATLARAASGVFDEIDALIDSYAQLWHELARIGLRQIAPLGQTIAADQIDPDRHEIVGARDRAQFVVRAPGLEVDGRVIARARLEGIA